MGSLTASCEIIGANPGSFNVDGCPVTGLAGGADKQLDVSCEPKTLGPLTATLRLTTNDADEGTVDFDLTCTGIESDTVFRDGFAS